MVPRLCSISTFWWSPAHPQVSLIRLLKVKESISGAWPLYFFKTSFTCLRNGITIRPEVFFCRIFKTPHCPNTQVESLRYRKTEAQSNNRWQRNPLPFPALHQLYNQQQLWLVPHQQLNKYGQTSSCTTLKAVKSIGLILFLRMRSFRKAFRFLTNLPMVLFFIPTPPFFKGAW